MRPEHMSDFSAIGAAPMPRGDRQYFTDGTYLCQILEVKKKRSVDPMKSEGELMVILEFSVVEVLRDRGEFQTPGQGLTKRSLQTGQLCQHILRMKWHSSLPSLKSFLRCAMGMNPSEALELESEVNNEVTAWTEIVDRAMYKDGEDLPPWAVFFEEEGIEFEPFAHQPLRGSKVVVSVDTVAQTKNPKKDWTNVEYQSLAEAGCE